MATLAFLHDMASVTVVLRSKAIPGFDDKLNDLSVAPLLLKIVRVSKLDAARVRLTYKSQGKHAPIDGSRLLSDYFSPEELKQGVTVYAKDLGPQMSWRQVYILEYLGPLLIHLLGFAVCSGVLEIAQSETQQLAATLAVLHFAKREYETVAVHKFSNDTMPLFNLFKNSGYYWLIAGLNIAVFVYGQNAITLAAAGPVKRFLFHVNDFSPATNYALVGLWVFAQVSNFSAHMTLSQIRATDAKRYAIPYGYGFNWVLCPNYFFELLGWLAYCLLVGNWTTWVFLLVGTSQMYVWAVKRHRRYIKTFGDEYKKLRRKVYFPFLL